MGWLAPLQGCSQGAGQGKVQLGKDPLPGPRGCWQPSVPCTWLDWRSQFLAVLAAGCFLPHGCLTACQLAAFFFFSEEDNTFTTCFFKAIRGTLSLCKTDVKISCNVIICRYSGTFHHFCHILMVKSKPNPNQISVLGGYAWVCMPRGTEITEATLESVCRKYLVYCVFSTLSSAWHTLSS